MSDSVTPWTAAHQDSLFLNISKRFLELMSTESMMTSKHLIPLFASPPVLSLLQHQGFFQQLSFSHQVVRVLELQLQHQSFQWIFRTDFLQDWLVWSPCSPRDFQESSPTQFRSIKHGERGASCDVSRQGWCRHFGWENKRLNYKNEGTSRSCRR